MTELKQRILKALSDCDFHKLCESNFIEKVVDYVNYDLIPFEWEYGASKLVLVLRNEDYVVKIPFSGEINNYYKEESLDGDGFFPFECAAEPDHWNYCETEAIVYQKAVEAGIKHLFAKTERIGFVKGYPIYIQPKVEVFCNCKTGENYSREKTSDTRQKCDDLDVICFHDEWLSDFLDYFNSDTLVRLDKLLRANNIFDLHGGNLGYTYENQPILLDYADFRD